MRDLEPGLERLVDLQVGGSCEMVGFSGCGRHAQRMAEMGMTPGVRLDILRAAPGQPMLLRVRRTLLAIDRESAADIITRPQESMGHGRGTGRMNRRLFGRRQRGHRWRK